MINGMKVLDCDPSFKITKYRDNFTRPVVKASLGCHVNGASLPHPCSGDTATIAAGARYRMARHFPGRPPDLRTEFRSFVRKWLRKNLTPLDPNSDTTLDTWLKKTPYTQARKDELRRKFIKSGLALDQPISSQYLKVKSFMKDECYPEFKHARAINSRTDEFKALVGPIFQLISDKLFALPWFIKKIPIKDRPQYIIDRLMRTGAWYYTSDYTSFEAHFTKELQEDCELQLHQYMTSELPSGKDWFEVISKAKTGCNAISFKNFQCKLDAKRMSGEMDTSTSNGFSNLMFMLFLLKKSGAKHIKGVIEGDDGLFCFMGNEIDKTIFSDFGLDIKLEKFENLNHASFCGMVFDVNDRTNVTNPIEELVSFGWTTAKYARSKDNVHKCLIRSKALSLAYQYPACPILTKFAYKMCELTASYDSLSFVRKGKGKAFCLYETEMILEAHKYFDKNGLLTPPGMRTRLLVEQLYGVTISDQILIEKYIDSLTEIAPIDCPVINRYCQPSWIQYDTHYVTFVRQKSRFFDDAELDWPSIRNRFDPKPFH